MTISNTNISSFSQAGITQEPGHDVIFAAPATTPIWNYARIGRATAGEATGLFLVNSTIANTPIGVSVGGQDPGRSRSRLRSLSRSC